MKKELRVIGKPTPKLDANIRASGQAVFGHDLVLPNMLHGAILRAAHPSADIISIDTSEAEKLPGVVCVITADDVDVNNISYRRDHPILKKGEVNCIRDEIAAAAADTKAAALKALSLIKVKYRMKQGIFDPFEALKEDAPRINKFYADEENKNIAHAFHYQHGDLEAQKAKSAVMVKNRYILPRVTHCCMETCAITADYSKTEKRLTLYSVTQVPFLYQRDMAHALKMEPSNIRIIQTVIGGGFGSKLDMYPYEPICALLSIKIGRPVQILFSREEEFIASPTRQPMVMDLTTGADKEGRFTFREVNIIKDNGAYTSWGATTPFVMMQTFSSLYQVPACKFDSYAVYTNNVYAGSFRGYGNPQATFALERNIYLMAEELDMDKAEIRLLNANFQGETTGQGLIFSTCGHGEALKYVIDKSGYQSKKGNNGVGRYRRGIGLASMLHVGGGAKIYRSDGCGTTVKFDSFGYLTIITGSTEIGQGSETVLAMIASEELGISLDKIRVINTDTDVKPWDVGVHASRTSFVAGNSLLGAVNKLKEKISPRAAAMLKTTVDDLEYVNGLINSQKTGEAVKIDKVIRDIHFRAPNELCIESYYYEPGSEFQDKKYMGNVSGTYAFAAQAVEVEVDTYTGNVEVLDVYVAQDVGKVLNPLGLAGQIEGGVVMGMGYALIEEMKVDEGRILNPSFHDYKLPTACDIPEIHFYPIETNDPAGPYGAKGVGEAPLIPTPAAIANAVSDALGIKIDELPITPEKVLKAVQSGKSEKIN
ncbi:xanthine dehydrogenase family protein molybdopterin-binding subunit [bacterium]|nr:xanthine dehydrogenase family protein molybdopterin-binding subunit [FCB group bacterium]MBL7191002.1 xanthine dehydrogenase family protein molybdopterin-binding subunit [bacterium]